MNLNGCLKCNHYLDETDEQPTGKTERQMVSTIWYKGIHRKCWRSTEWKRTPTLGWRAMTGIEEYQLNTEECQWRLRTTQASREAPKGVGGGGGKEYGNQFSSHNPDWGAYVGNKKILSHSEEPGHGGIECQMKLRSAISDKGDSGVPAPAEKGWKKQNRMRNEMDTGPILADEHWRWLRCTYPTKVGRQRGYQTDH